MYHSMFAFKKHQQAVSYCVYWPLKELIPCRPDVLNRININNHCLFNNNKKGRDLFFTNLKA